MQLSGEMALEQTRSGITAIRAMRIPGFMKKQVALRLREPLRWGPGIIGLWIIRRLCLGADVWTRQHSKDLFCSGQIFFADEDFEAGAGPSEMFAHSASSVGTQHGADSSVFEQAF